MSAPPAQGTPACPLVTLLDDAHVELPAASDAQGVRDLAGQLETLRAQVAQASCPGGLLAGLAAPLELGAVSLATREVVLRYGPARWPLRFRLRAGGELDVGEGYVQHLVRVERMHALASWLEAHPEVRIMSSVSLSDGPANQRFQRSRASTENRTVVCLAPEAAPGNGVCVATPRVERHVWSSQEADSFMVGPLDARGRAESFRVDLAARTACRGDSVRVRVGAGRPGPSWSYWSREDALLPSSFEHTRCDGSAAVAVEPGPEWLGLVDGIEALPVRMGVSEQAVAMRLSVETSSDFESARSDVLCVYDQRWRCGGMDLGGTANPISIYAVWRVPTSKGEAIWYVAQDMYGGSSFADVLVEDEAWLGAPRLDGHTWSGGGAIPLGTGARVRTPDPPVWVHSRRYMAPRVLGEDQVELIRREAERTVWHPQSDAGSMSHEWRVVRRSREELPQHRCCTRSLERWHCQDGSCYWSGDELRVDHAPESVEAHAPSRGAPRP